MSVTPLLSDVTPDYIASIQHELGLSPRTVTTYSSRLNHNFRWLQANGYPDPNVSAFTAALLRRYLYAGSARGLRPRTLWGLFNPLVGRAILWSLKNFSWQTLPKTS